MYCKWSKAFLDSGKSGLARDTKYDATSDEVQCLKHESNDKKKALAAINLLPMAQTVSLAGQSACFQDRSPCKGRVRRQILSEERENILAAAMLYPAWSHGEVVCRVADHVGFTVEVFTIF